MLLTVLKSKSKLKLLKLFFSCALQKNDLKAKGKHTNIVKKFRVYILIQANNKNVNDILNKIILKLY